MKRLVLITLALSLLAPTALAKSKSGGGDNSGGNKNNSSNNSGGGNDGGGRDLKLKKGWMELGGSATLDITSYDGNNSWQLNLQPQAGYFIKKGLEVIGGLGVGITEGSTSWNVNGGLRYFIDMNPMWAYVGGRGLYYPESDLMVSAFGADALGGVLLPLSQNVALDLGASLGMQKYDGADKSVINFSGGYLGVSGFFKP
jgi:hypothetical protein